MAGCGARLAAAIESEVFSEHERRAECWEVERKAPVTHTAIGLGKARIVVVRVVVRAKIAVSFIMGSKRACEQEQQR